MEACAQAVVFVLGEEEDVGVCEAETCFREGAQHVQGPEAGRGDPAVL